MSRPAKPRKRKPKRVINGARALMASRKDGKDTRDFFPTPPFATRALCEHVLPLLQFGNLTGYRIWEPACGEGHMAEVLREYSSTVRASDVHDYGYGELFDFLDPKTYGMLHMNQFPDLIITNPPFRDAAAERFIERALLIAQLGVAMFVRQQFLETIGRYERLFRDNPPSLIAFFSERVNLCKGRWDPKGSTATAYCWLVWVTGMSPLPPLWIPPGCRERLTKPNDVERFTSHPVKRGV
jgi:hypothetical protein